MNDFIRCPLILWDNIILAVLQKRSRKSPSTLVCTAAELTTKLRLRYMTNVLQHDVKIVFNHCDLQLSVLLFSWAHNRLTDELMTIYTLIFSIIISHSKNNHEDSVTHCSECYRDEIKMANMISNKIKGLVRIYNIF